MFIWDLETDSQIEKYKSFTDNIRKNDTQAGIQIWGLFITLGNEDRSANEKMMIIVDLVINKIYLIIFFWNKIIYKSHCKAVGDFLANEKIGKIYYSSVPRAK